MTAAAAINVSVFAGAKPLASVAMNAKDKMSAITASTKIKLTEKDIQKTCEGYLELDGWRIFRMEQNFSERKVKSVGEAGMPDTLAIRYGVSPFLCGAVQQITPVFSGDVAPSFPPQCAEVLWIEWKVPKGRVSASQMAWHLMERSRGAFVLVAGMDFPARIDGFLEYYRGSHLNRGKV